MAGEVNVLLIVNGESVNICFARGSVIALKSTAIFRATTKGSGQLNCFDKLL